MLSTTKILLILTLFSLLLFRSHGQEGQRKNTTQSTAEGLKTGGNESVPLESKANLTLDKENRETFNSKASNFSLEDPSNKTHGANFHHNLSTNNFSRSPSPMPTPSPSPIHSFVSKLPWNSSIADENSLPVSRLPNATATGSSENFTWSSVNDTTKAPGNSSITVSNLPLGPNSTPETSIMETDGWHTTTRDSLAELTPYQETTLQPTLKFTNNSKIFPNTADSQEENRNTGVVFGAILGAILGASLLSLVGYLLCGKSKTDSFSHRRLYDDRNEPVLRLDNAPEPYDVSFGNSSYYNPTANDSSTAAGLENARDGIPMDDIPSLRTSV
uniref:Mucin 15, cell surface associated n=1 Tax=Catagonus wagneri TaxID=51154 RepID=A0A8C3W6E5_9CETA